MTPKQAWFMGVVLWAFALCVPAARADEPVASGSGVPLSTEQKETTTVAPAPVVAPHKGPQAPSMSDEEILRQFRQLQQQMEQLQAVLRARGIDPTVTPNPKSQTANSKSDAWADHLRISGDLRLRFESIHRPGMVSRTRPRFRLRTDFAAPLSGNLEAHLRLTTGDPREPASPYQTFGDFLGKKPFNIDRAYIAYKPKGGSEFSAGKGPCRFLGTELIWDQDTQIDGAMQVFNLGRGLGADNLSLALGQFLLNEVANASDTRAFGIQLRAEKEIAPKQRLTLALGRQNFSNLDPLAVAISKGNLLGGTSNRFRRDAAGNVIGYVSKFRLTDALLRYHSGTWRLPLEATLHYVKNSGARDQNTAFWLEAFVGSNKKKGEWRYGYTYGRIGADAVLAVFNNDDFNHTNLVGHQGHLFYMLSDRTELHFNLFRQKNLVPAGATNPTETKVRINVTTKF